MRSSLLVSALALLGCTNASPVASSKLIARNAEPSINQAMKGKGKKYFGNIGEADKFSNPSAAGILKADFGALTPEYSMKWQATQPSQGQFTFDAGDAVVNFAEANGMLVRGHALLWHRDLPDWVNTGDKNQLTSYIQDHISNVVGHYKGRIYAWDVVNEIFDDNGGFRSSVFYNVLGEDFVRIAFEAARAADPAAKLYINDYNLDAVGWSQYNMMMQYVPKWIGEGIPIDGIGSQSHLYSSLDVRVPFANLCGVVSECAITELDIAGADQNAYNYATQACISAANCVGVTVWGIRDTDSWRSADTPLLFDVNWAAKNVYYGLVDYITNWAY